MSKKRDNSLLLEDMLDCCNKILEYTKDIDYDSFTDNNMVKEIQ
jgi:uncharacterized protein with HEPN domain